MHVVKRKGEADEERYDIPIDGFFLAIGHKPNSDLFKEYLDTDEVGYIKTIDGTPRTNIPGVYAAGDVMWIEDLKEKTDLMRLTHENVPNTSSYFKLYK